MKRILAIDTCGTVGSVELFDCVSGNVLGQASLPGRETQEKLLPAVQSVLAGAECSLADVSALAVITGPGSFTGVRIGLAAAKGLGEAAGIPVIALSRLAVLAASSRIPPQNTLHAWLDAGRGDVYSLTAGPDEHGSQWSERLLSGDEARSRVREGDAVVVIEPVLQERFQNLEPPAVLVSREDYLHSFRSLAAQAAESGRFADTALLDANYLRSPDAELALRARGGLAAVPQSKAMPHTA